MIWTLPPLPPYLALKRIIGTLFTSVSIFRNHTSTPLTVRFSLKMMAASGSPERALDRASSGRESAGTTCSGSPSSEGLSVRKERKTCPLDEAPRNGHQHYGPVPDPLHQVDKFVAL